MFLGEYQHNLDSKSRMIIPSKYREMLGESFVITKGYDRCAFLYDMNEWNILLEKLKQLPKSDPEIRRFERLFIGGATLASPDSQGRVVFPQNLREYGDVTKAIVFVGTTNRIEIWAKEKWDEYNIGMDGDPIYLDDTIAAKMTGLGI